MELQSPSWSLNNSPEGKNRDLMTLVLPCVSCEGTGPCQPSRTSALITLSAIPRKRQHPCFPPSVLTQVFLSIMPPPHSMPSPILFGKSFTLETLCHLSPARPLASPSTVLTSLWLAFVTCKQRAISRSFCLLSSLPVSSDACGWASCVVRTYFVGSL